MLAVQQQQQHFVRPDDPTGQRLDAISDAVDAINVDHFKANHPELANESPDDVYAASQFDEGKEKETFREYKENSGPFKFYSCVSYSWPVAPASSPNSDALTPFLPPTPQRAAHQADGRVQPQGPGRRVRQAAGDDGRVGGDGAARHAR